jgi:hypothetical protein
VVSGCYTLQRPPQQPGERKQRNERGSETAGETKFGFSTERPTEGKLGQELGAKVYINVSLCYHHSWYKTTTRVE